MGPTGYSAGTAVIQAIGGVNAVCVANHQAPGAGALAALAQLVGPALRATAPAIGIVTLRINALVAAEILLDRTLTGAVLTGAPSFTDPACCSVRATGVIRGASTAGVVLTAARAGTTATGALPVLACLPGRAFRAAGSAVVHVANGGGTGDAA